MAEPTEIGASAAPLEHVVNPLHQIRHLTRHMSKAVALNVDTTMKNRTKSSISHAQRSNSDESSGASEASSSDQSSSEDSSPNASPTALVSTMPLPLDGATMQQPPPVLKIRKSPYPASGESLLMPGKTFLESFYLFLKQHAKSLRVRNPRLQVLINPPCLHYLEGCFNAMLLPTMNEDSGVVLQWQARKDLVNVEDDPRKIPQGMSKTNRMLKLAGYVLNIIDVSIQALPDTMPLPSRCNLSIFSSLLYLKMDGVGLEDIQNLHALRKQLIELHLTRCKIAALGDVLGEKLPWPALKALRLIDCHLPKLDPCLALAPNLHTLSVASNELQSLTHLENCRHLTSVDVSRNRLSSAAGAHRFMSNVTTLDISHNQLTSTAGLEKMLSLHTLDLRHNALATTGEVAFLVSLPLLERLNIEGNPFFDTPYRTRVLELLGKEVVLDHTPWTPDELRVADNLHHPSIDVLHDVSIAKEHEDDTPASPFYDMAVRLLEIARSLVHDVAGRAVVVCCILVVAHGLTRVIWTSDSSTSSHDDFMTKTVATLLVVTLAVALPVYGLSWWTRGSHGSHSSLNASTPLSPRLTKQLSLNNQSNQVDEDQGQVASLDVLSTALEVLVESPKAMPLHDFINLASEVSKLLEFLGQMGSFARKTWVSDEAILHRLWQLHRRDSNVTIQALVRDDVEKEQPHSLTRTLLRMVPVLMFVRNLCLELEKDSDATLQHCASSAYAHTLAKQCKHAWLVQKAIISSIQLCPTTRTELLLMWDVEDHEQDIEFKEQRLHACGRMLDIVVVNLAKLRDVYNLVEQ